jgi:hypothetical protein
VELLDPGAMAGVGREKLRRLLFGHLLHALPERDGEIIPV